MVVFYYTHLGEFSKNRLGYVLLKSGFWRLRCIVLGLLYGFRDQLGYEENSFGIQ